MSETNDADIIVEESVFTLDGSEAKNERAEFATVVFHNIAETYPVDAHIECSYTVTADLVPTTRDWVGLYKVGWMSPRDYIYYEWAPIPAGYEVGADADASVLFPAHKLPNDDGEFYQFCYVSSSSQIRGASTPFQFRKPGADEFVEIEDEETNMLVIRSKTLYLEENLQKAEIKRQKLVESFEALQKERDTIIVKYQGAKNKLLDLETDNRTLTGQVSQGQGEIEQLQVEARDMMTLREELELKIENNADERSKLEAEIHSLTEETDKLKADIRGLMSGNDKLAGENANLQEQVEMYKNQYTATETTVEHYTKHSEDLQLQLATQESLIDHLKHTVEKLQAELLDNQQNLDKQTAINIQDKEHGQLLEARLKNTEDKLCAAEESKNILQNEILSYDETRQQLSRQLEKSKTDCESVKHKLCRLEEDFTQKTQIQTAEIDQTTADLMLSLQEKEKVQEENSMLREKLSSSQDKSDMKHGSMNIMKQSLTQIKERLEKKERHCRSLEKTLRSREQEFMERECEMRREVEDLKEKIYMCSEEYKTLYVEKSKLQRKLQKTAEKRRTRQSKAVPEPTLESAAMQNSETTSQACETESKVSEAEVCDAREDVSTCTETDTTAGALEAQMDEVADELVHMLVKKEKYKNLYHTEKSAREALERDVNNKQAEIEQLHKRIMEIPNESDLKLRSLEKCVSEKEMRIEQLNQKLRLANQGRNDETGASMLPRTSMQYSSSTGHDAAPNAGISLCHVPYMVYPHQNTELPYMYSPQRKMPVAGAPHMIYPSTPITYPGHATPIQWSGPPVPPRKKPVTRRAPPPLPSEETEPAVVKEGSTEELPLLTEGRDQTDFYEPLTPLPAPLVPEKLPSAKVAAVRSTSTHVDADVDEFMVESELTVKLPSPIVEGAADIREDRFYDAEGMSMKWCPICNKSFPADVDEGAFQEHQVAHTALCLCPICKECKPDNMTDDDFARHVNSHCEKEDAMWLAQ